MTSDSEKLENLLLFIRSENRICPMPREWNKLWEILPNKERVGAGWNPPLPLILAAWHKTTHLEKIERLRTHIQYAADHSVLDEVDTFLRSLSPNQWLISR